MAEPSPRGAEAKSTTAIDRQVGKRVRMRRMLVGMSQEKLGDAIGVTFQQIQKYEKGTNRISVSRLQQIASALEVPISYFYEDTGKTSTSKEGSPEFDLVSQILSRKDTVDLVRAFLRIDDSRVRHAFVELMRAAAESPPQRRLVTSTIRLLRPPASPD